jgi:hypothetical protein
MRIAGKENNPWRRSLESHKKFYLSQSFKITICDSFSLESHTKFYSSEPFVNLIQHVTVLKNVPIKSFVNPILVS